MGYTKKIDFLHKSFKREIVRQSRQKKKGILSTREKEKLERKKESGPGNTLERPARDPESGEER